MAVCCRREVSIIGICRTGRENGHAALFVKCMNLNNASGGTSVAQWAGQAIQNAYQKTSNAIGKAIKKNRVRLKYGTQVYLVNSKQSRKK